MDDESKLPPLAFTPVPRQCERHDGWTPERQTLFIEALADYGSVRAAANAVGLAPEGAYRLRRQPGAESFAAAWEAALTHGVKRIEDALMDRALNGVEVPVYSYGKLLGTRTSYNDRLGMFILRNRAPERFAEGKPKAMNALDMATLKKLKKQWEADYKRQQAIEEGARYKQEGEDLFAKIERMHRTWYRCLSPASRAAYREFRRLEDLDNAAGFTWMGEEGAEPASVADAEYEEFFNRDRDKRAQIWKLVDTREWENPAYEEDGEEVDPDAD